MVQKNTTHHNSRVHPHQSLHLPLHRHGRSNQPINRSSFLVYKSITLNPQLSQILHQSKSQHLIGQSKLLSMSPAPSITGLRVETVAFPPALKPPGSNSTHFLAGAGARGLNIEEKFVKFTAIGVYLDEKKAVETLAGKWKGKSADELDGSVPFFREVVTGPFEKFLQVTMILPLTGPQYTQKVSENCIAIWKALGIYTEAEAKAIQKFIEVFKEENFPPGASILFTLSSTGSLTIAFSKDGSIPEVGTAVIENKLLAESVFESIVGKGGVSPATRQSVAARLSELLKE